MLTKYRNLLRLIAESENGLECEFTLEMFDKEKNFHNEVKSSGRLIASGERILMRLDGKKKDFPVSVFRILDEFIQLYYLDESKAIGEKYIHVITNVLAPF